MTEIKGGRNKGRKGGSKKRERREQRPEVIQTWVLIISGGLEEVREMKGIIRGAGGGGGEGTSAQEVLKQASQL